MRKTRNAEEERKMSKILCKDLSTKDGKTALYHSVELIIKQNKKVFDNLAKS